MALTNADLGISESNAFADTPVETQQTAKTSKPSTRMQSAASSGVAPPVTAPTAVASQPEQPVLPPVPTASAAAPANIQSPAQSGDFWKSAFTSALPSVIGGLGLAAGGYLAGRGSQGGGGGGGAVPPPVDEEMRQLKLAQEQAKHEALVAENYRRQQAHDAKLANEAKIAESRLQKMQGTASSPTSADQQATELIKKSEENKVSKAVIEASKPKPVAPPPAPVTQVAPEVVTPVTESEPPPSKQTKAPKPKMEMPEGWGKGMSWLVNQHGIEGAQDFIDRYNNGKPFATYDEMMKAYQEKTTRPKYSDIPKDVRKSRGIVPPPQGGGMGVPPPRMGGGGRLNETGRPGEEIIHNLNPLKL